MEVVRINGEPDGDLGPGERTDPPADDVADRFGYRLVLVTWRDAWFDFDEPDPEDVRPDYLVNTVGFLVRQGSRFVSIAQEILPDGDGFRAVTHIPVSVVERMCTLREPGDGGVRDLATP